MTREREPGQRQNWAMRMANLSLILVEFESAMRNENSVPLDMINLDIEGILAS